MNRPATLAATHERTARFPTAMNRAGRLARVATRQPDSGESRVARSRFLKRIRGGTARTS